MADNNYPQLKRRLASLLSGMLIAQAIWALLLAAVFAGGEVFGILVVPSAAIGYFMVWGDNTPPQWAQSTGLHIGFSLCFYGTIGALIGMWTNRALRFSLRTLLIAATLVALTLGLIVWLT